MISKPIGYEVCEEGSIEEMASSKGFMPLRVQETPSVPTSELDVTQNVEQITGIDEDDVHEVINCNDAQLVVLNVNESKFYTGGTSRYTGLKTSYNT